MSNKTVFHFGRCTEDSKLLALLSAMVNLTTFQAQLVVWKKSQGDALLQGKSLLICSNGSPSISFFPLSYTFSLPSCSDNIFLLPHHHGIRREYRKPSVWQTAYRQLAWEVLNRSQVRAERKPGTQQMVWILADAEDEEKSHKQSDVVKRDGPPKQKTEKRKKGTEQRGNVNGQRADHSALAFHFLLTARAARVGSS